MHVSLFGLVYVPWLLLTDRYEWAAARLTSRRAR